MFCRGKFSFWKMNIIQTFIYLFIYYFMYFTERAISTEHSLIPLRLLAVSNDKWFFTGKKPRLLGCALYQRVFATNQTITRCLVYFQHLLLLFLVGGEWLFYCFKFWREATKNQAVAGPCTKLRQGQLFGVWVTYRSMCIHVEYASENIAHSFTIFSELSRNN